MDDTGGVRGPERGGDVLEDRERLAGWERPLAGDPLLERPPVEELHREERDPPLRSLVKAEVEDPADVRVRHLPGEEDLAAEALAGLLLARGAQRSEGDDGAELEVLGLVDVAHAAAPEGATDAVAAREDRPGSQRTGSVPASGFPVMTGKCRAPPAAGAPATFRSSGSG